MHEAGLGDVGEAEALRRGKGPLHRRPEIDPDQIDVQSAREIPQRGLEAGIIGTGERRLLFRRAARPRRGRQASIGYVGHQEIDGAMRGKVLDHMPDAEGGMGEPRRRIRLVERAPHIVAAAEHDVKRTRIGAGEGRQEEVEIGLIGQAVGAASGLGAADGEIGTAAQGRARRQPESRGKILDPERAVGKAPVVIGGRGRFVVQRRDMGIAGIGEAVAEDDDLRRPCRQLGGCRGRGQEQRCKREARDDRMESRFRGNDGIP